MSSNFVSMDDYLALEAERDDLARRLALADEALATFRLKMIEEVYADPTGQAIVLSKPISQPGQYFTTDQISDAFAAHAGEDSWGVPSFYEGGLLAALRGEYDDPAIARAAAPAQPVSEPSDG